MNTKNNWIRLLGCISTLLLVSVGASADQKIVGARLKDVKTMEGITPYLVAIAQVCPNNFVSPFAKITQLNEDTVVAELGINPRVCVTQEEPVEFVLLNLESALKDLGLSLETTKLLIQIK